MVAADALTETGRRDWIRQGRVFMGTRALLPALRDHCVLFGPIPQTCPPAAGNERNFGFPGNSSRFGRSLIIQVCSERRLFGNERGNAADCSELS